MVYIYADESGDMGYDFTKIATSRYFSLAFLVATERRTISTLIRKVFLSLPRAEKRRSSGVLHAHYEKPSTRKMLLKGLASRDIKISSIRLDKRKVLLAENPHDLYISMVVAMINRLYSDKIIGGDDDIELVASRANTSRCLNARFSDSVVSRIGGKNFSVKIMKPSDDKCLQAVDFISWALWQKYEKEDNTYAALIEGKIVREYAMYE